MPIAQLGDRPGKLAPVRECQILGFDGQRHCTVHVGRVSVTFEARYLYQRPGRHGYAPPVERHELVRLARAAA